MLAHAGKKFEAATFSFSLELMEHLVFEILKLYVCNEFFVFTDEFHQPGSDSEVHVASMSL